MSITRKEGVKGGRPIVENTKLSVVQVKELLDSDMSAETIVNSYQQLTREDIKAVQEYIEENPEKVKRLEKEREQAKERLRERAANDDTGTYDA